MLEFLFEVFTAIGFLMITVGAVMLASLVIINIVNWLYEKKRYIGKESGESLFEKLQKEFMKEGGGEND